jgi:prohibitin 2
MASSQPIFQRILPFAFLSAGIGAIGYSAFNCFYTVQGGHSAVVFNRFYGIKDQVYEEGLHYVIPWIEWPIIYDVRTRPHTINSLTGSKDLQMVNISLRVLSKPDRSQLPFIYRRLGRNFDERVLPSIVNEVCKSVVAKYNASELLTRREIVSRQISDTLKERAADFKILLDDASITHLTFSNEYTAAVEAKQVAQQEAQRARYWVQKAKLEKESTIIRAEGEAQSAKLIGQSIKNNPAFIQLRRIDTARDISEVISKSANNVYLTSDTLLLNLLNPTPSIEAHPLKK